MHCYTYQLYYYLWFVDFYPLLIVNSLTFIFCQYIFKKYYKRFINKSYYTLMQEEKNSFKVESKSSLFSGQIMSQIISPISQTKQQEKNDRQTKIFQAIRNSVMVRQIGKNEQSIKKEEDAKKIVENIENSEIESEIFVQDGFINLFDFQSEKNLGEKQYIQKVKQQYGFQGVLQKQSPSIFGSWTNRYCILRRNRFVYKEEEFPISKNDGILNFNLISCDLERNVQKGVFAIKLKIKNSDKFFVFKAKSNEITEKWYATFEDQIKSSFGFNKNLKYLGHYHRFWKKDYISNRQFEDSAETGDILLFRGTKNTSVWQRAITFEEFDHIGIVLLNQRKDVLIFQANGGFGVGLCPWSKFIKKKWYHQQDLVVYRKLNIYRSHYFSQEIQKYVEKNLGKKYQFSVSNYLFNRKSKVNSEKQTFFCSQLVAKLYKQLGLLSQQKSSSQYLPSYFCQNNKKNLKSGKYGRAFLQKEKIIVFQQQLLKKQQ